VRRILRQDNQIKAFLLAGDTRAHDALLLWADTELAPQNISQVLMGRSKATVRAQIVCTCESVTDQTLEQAIAAGHGLEQLKANLKCGTGCGSCVPQIKQMIQRSKMTEHAI
jgi:assimilatory nitrate reductase catalytic subunit